MEKIPLINVVVSVALHKSDKHSWCPIDASDAVDNNVSPSFAELAIDFVKPAPVEESVKNVGRVRIGLDLLSLGEEKLVCRFSG